MSSAEIWPAFEELAAIEMQTVLRPQEGHWWPAHKKATVSPPLKQAGLWPPANGRWLAARFLPHL